MLTLQKKEKLFLLRHRCAIKDALAKLCRAQHWVLQICQSVQKATTGRAEATGHDRGVLAEWSKEPKTGTTGWGGHLPRFETADDAAQHLYANSGGGNRYLNPECRCIVRGVKKPVEHRTELHLAPVKRYQTYHLNIKTIWMQRRMQAGKFGPRSELHDYSQVSWCGV